MAEPGFVEFVSRSSLIVERLLGRDEVFDVFVVSGDAGAQVDSCHEVVHCRRLPTEEQVLKMNNQPVLTWCGRCLYVAPGLRSGGERTQARGAGERHQAHAGACASRVTHIPSLTYKTPPIQSTHTLPHLTDACAAEGPPLTLPSGRAHGVPALLSTVLGGQAVRGAAGDGRALVAALLRALPGRLQHHGRRLGGCVRWPHI